jgi:hypothetical protein
VNAPGVPTLQPTLLPSLQAPTLLFPGVTLDLPNECLGHVRLDRLRHLAADGCIVERPVAGGAPAGFGTVARLDRAAIPGAVRVRGVMRVRIVGGWTVEGAPAVEVEPVLEATGPDDFRLADTVREATLARRRTPGWAASALRRTEDPTRIADVA